MGSPAYAYRQILRKFVRISTQFDPRYKGYTDEFIANMSEEQLEKIALAFKDENYPMACFNAGIACANYINDPKLCNDEINAAFGGISEIEVLFGIEDEDDE